MTTSLWIQLLVYLLCFLPFQAFCLYKLNQKWTTKYIQKRRPLLLVLIVLCASSYATKLTFLQLSSICIIPICDDSIIFSILDFSLVLAIMILFFVRLWIIFYDLKFGESNIYNHSRNNWFVRHRTTYGSLTFLWKYMLAMYITLIIVILVIYIILLQMVAFLLYAFICNILWIT
eukprot:142901_1